ncbi:MAG: RsmB/NOP family class I SAM-dependent RNA methyltransferase [bacterium]
MSFKEILKEYDFVSDKEEFWNHLISPKPTYFRINLIKADTETVINCLTRYPDLEIEKIKLNDNQDYFVVKKGSLTKKPEHLFGYLYVQDISSGLVVTSFNNTRKPALIVDMCASPGGKTTLLATMFPNSIVIANDIGHDRIKALVHNIQRMGTLNVIVTQCNAAFFPKIINKQIDFILADVPCSAESNLNDYQNYNVQKHYSFVNHIKDVQYKLLSRALQIANQNTEIVYSTCTFNPLENEYIINSILEQNLAQIIPITTPNLHNIKPGIVEYKQFKFSQDLQKTIRVYPYNMTGMFIAKLNLTNNSEPGINKHPINSEVELVPIDQGVTFQGKNIKIIDYSMVYEHLSSYGIPESIIKNLVWFYKCKQENEITDIYVTSLKEIIVKKKGPLTVEYFGLKALRYFKPLKIYKPTSTFLSVMNRYINQNYVELDFNIDLLKKFISRQEIDRQFFREVNIKSNQPFIAVKFNSIVIGCGSIKNNKIQSEIPSSKANFINNIL